MPFPSPIQTARQLRKQMTVDEKILWEELRAHGFKDYKIRRQHPIVYQQIQFRKFFYVADFYCGRRKLVIELDGKFHEFPEIKEYDNARDALMKDMGIKILRIKNEEFMDMGKVLQKIDEALKL